MNSANTANNTVIIYKKESGGVAIVTPSEDALASLTMLQIGQISVPRGAPFWIVDCSLLPTDQTYSDAWELDIATLPVADGYGEADD